MSLQMNWIMKVWQRKEGNNEDSSAFARKVMNFKWQIWKNRERKVTDEIEKEEIEDNLHVNVKKETCFICCEWNILLMAQQN